MIPASVMSMQTVIMYSYHIRNIMFYLGLSVGVMHLKDTSVLFLLLHFSSFACLSEKITGKSWLMNSVEILDFRIGYVNMQLNLKEKLVSS